MRPNAASLAAGIEAMGLSFVVDKDSRALGRTGDSWTRVSEAECERDVIVWVEILRRHFGWRADVSKVCQVCGLTDVWCCLG